MDKVNKDDKVMIERRRNYNNELNNKIAILENSVKRDKSTLEGLSRLGFSETVLREKRKEIEDNLKRKTDEIQFVNTEKFNVDVGMFDDSINKLYKTIEKKEIKKEIKKEVAPLKKDEGKKKKKHNKVYDTVYDPLKKYESSYKYFVSVDPTLPEYIRENLKTMPNNKGYIFRDCWYFGLMEEDTTKPFFLTMFEKKGNVMRIHEITEKEYLIYEKIGQNRKQLISRRSRKHKVLGNARRK